ncbi:hypothetical protein SAMN05892883_2187 [Jatrophihabitans sp. GAS493]|nr:hypothetical protein SAMN05892883_2187 [Jatrophihabitans sp. GAS493]
MGHVRLLAPDPKSPPTRESAQTKRNHSSDVAASRARRSVAGHRLGHAGRRLRVQCRAGRTRVVCGFGRGWGVGREPRRNRRFRNARANWLHAMPWAQHLPRERMRSRERAGTCPLAPIWWLTSEPPNVTMRPWLRATNWLDLPTPHLCSATIFGSTGTRSCSWRPPAREEKALGGTDWALLAHQTRYMAACRLYRAQQRASLVINCNDPSRPRLIRD